MTEALPAPVLRPPEPAHDVDLAALAADLRAEVDGEIRFDAGSRAAFGPDERALSRPRATREALDQAGVLS
jgi:hypothetical protein